MDWKKDLDSLKNDPRFKVLESFESEIEKLDEKEQQELLGRVVPAIIADKVELDEAIRRHTDNETFALQYRLWKKDLAGLPKTLRKMPTSLMSPEHKIIFQQMAEKLLEIKLSAMRDHYKGTWDGDIEDIPAAG